MAINRILVLGTGGVGSLVARLLQQIGCEVTTFDQEKNTSLPAGIASLNGDASDHSTLMEHMKNQDAVVSCLPYQLTIGVAKAAHESGIHYFDPTEDVASTDMIRSLSDSATAAMVPQNGLAPGFIGILGAHLANQFDSGKLRNIKMRVGALPENPIGQLGYAGNWSLDGLVHECIADCDVVIDGKRQKIPALRNPEIIRINGIEYEAFTTSGGLGTMTETYEGNVETLNYKSIRYKGHYDGMKLLLEELRFREDPDELVKRLGYALPPDDNDRVLIHASVQGEMNGKLQTKEIVTDYKPMEIDGKSYTAIAWTTASSIVAVIELVSLGKLPQQGFVRQENIPLSDFLNTQTGSFYCQDHNEFQKIAKGE